MAITTEVNRTAELTCDGIETDFDFSMLIYLASELQVFYKPTGDNYSQLTLNTDYGVVFTEDGGTVSTNGYTAPLAAGTILIIRHLALTQQTNWLYNDNHTEQTHQDDFDRAVMRDLQIQEQLDRCSKFATFSSTTGVILPEPVANQFLGWNAAGDDLENKTPAAAAGLAIAFDDLTDADVGVPVAGDIVRWTGAVWEKHADSNYLSAQTIGIEDDNLLEVDGAPNSGEFAKFTASGLEGRTVTENRDDLGLGTGDSPFFEGIIVKDSSGNIIFYVDDDELYFTAAIAAGVGEPIGLLLALTHAA